MYKEIIDLLKKAWNYLKKIFVKIVDFFKNVIMFFKNKMGLVKQKAPNAVAISLKVNENLNTGNYNSVNLNDFNTDTIVNTFYDKDTGNILEEHTEVVSYESLDQVTKNQFGNKEMLVLNN